MHWDLTTCSPLRSVARSFAVAGSTQWPPDWFTMYATARPISRSVRPGLLPWDGILRMPSSACRVRLVRPCEARWLQAFWSPILGAPFAPVAWHAAQTAWTTSLPLRSGPCACAGCDATGIARARSAAPIRILRDMTDCLRSSMMQLASIALLLTDDFPIFRKSNYLIIGETNSARKSAVQAVGGLAWRGV